MLLLLLLFSTIVASSRFFYYFPLVLLWFTSFKFLLLLLLLHAVAVAGSLFVVAADVSVAVLCHVMVTSYCYRLISMILLVFYRYCNFSL